MISLATSGSWFEVIAICERLAPTEFGRLPNKRFAVKENKRLEFRFSAFNFLNHPNPQLGISGNSDLNLNFSKADGSLSQINQNTNTTGRALFTTGRRVVEFMAKFTF